MPLSRFVIAAAAGMLFACKQDTAEPVVPADVNASVDHAYTESAIIPLFPLVNALQAGPGAWAGIVSHTCATLDSITGDTAAFPANGPVTLHLHYPDLGCTDIDGRVRIGSMTVTMTNVLSSPGAIVMISSPDLKIDQYRFRFGLRDSAAYADTAIVRVDSSFIFTQGDWARRYHGNYRYALTSGFGDPDPTNDRYTITAVLNGLDRVEEAYVASTIDSLIFDMSCQWLGTGRFSVMPVDGVEQVLDYGTGTCENMAWIERQGDQIGLTIP